MAAAGTIVAIASNIPWKQVIENTPKITDAAVKVWNSITGRKKQDSIEDRIAFAAEAAGSDEIESMKNRLAVFEDEVNTLRGQLQASAEVLKTLAEQNILLVERIELNRKRLNRQMIVIAAIGGMMIVGIGYLFMVR